MTQKIEATCKAGQEVFSPRDERDPRIWLTDYHVKQTLGQGSFGKVKLGVHKKTGQEFALKFIDQFKVLNTKFGMKYRREIEIHKELDHPNIAKIFQIIEAPQVGYTVLVMEYIKGGDLLDLVLNNEEGKMKMESAGKYFGQLLSAVQYLHKKGIVHRDLKLENIMVDDTGTQIKLIDFGFTNEWSTSKMLSTPCGSPIYSAPEILRKEKYQGPASDVWSMGVILYAMVCGNIPWEGMNTQRQMINTCKGRWVDSGDIPMELMRLFNAVFQVDPKERASLDDIIESEWFSRYGGLPQSKPGKLKNFLRRMSSGILFDGN